MADRGIPLRNITNQYKRKMRFLGTSADIILIPHVLSIEARNHYKKLLPWSFPYLRLGTCITRLATPA